MATAVIGTSHCKALRYAPNTIKHDPLDARAYYYVRKGWKAEPVGSDENGPIRLVALPHLEGDDGIVIEGYDTLVVSGGGCPSASNHILEAGQHPLCYMACPGWGYDSDRVAPGVRLVSTAVFEATVEAWVRQQPLMLLLQRLFAATDCRIFLQPAPAPNRKLKTDPEWMLNRWYGPAAPKAWLTYLMAQLRALRVIAGELGPRVVLLDFPLAEAFEDGFMDESFCNPDPFHANPLYGRLVVNQIAKHMGVTVGASRAPNLDLATGA